MDNRPMGLSRRDMLASILASSCLASMPALAAGEERYDPQNPDLLFGTVSSIWGNDLDTVVSHAARLRFQGVEFFRRNVLPYVDSQSLFMDLYHKVRGAGLSFIDVANGGPGMAENFVDPAKTPKTVAEHI